MTTDGRRLKASAANTTESTIMKVSVQKHSLKTTSSPTYHYDNNCTTTVRKMHNSALGTQWTLGVQSFHFESVSGLSGFTLQTFRDLFQNENLDVVV